MDKKRVDHVLTFESRDNFWSHLERRKCACRNKDKVLESLCNALLHVRVLIRLDKLVDQLLHKPFFTKPLSQKNSV